MPIPKATSRTFQLARIAVIESIRFAFRFDAAPLGSGFRYYAESCCGFSHRRRKWRPMRSVRNAIVVGFAIILGLGQARAGEFDSILRWRNIGPYRGGRTRAVCGVPSQPNVFYMAPVNGGVLNRSITAVPGSRSSTISRRRRSVRLQSRFQIRILFTLAAAKDCIDPDLSVGDGIYKSTDAGKTWTHLGLRDGQQIAQLAVDPKKSGPHLCGRSRSSVRA